YHFGFDRWYGDAGAIGVDGEGPGSCLGRVIADDGTLCPSVVLPGLEVPLPLGRELLDIVGNADRDVALMCEPLPHHAFVYYQQGVPVGEVRLSFSCAKLSVAPGPEVSQHSPELKAHVRDLCHRAGMKLCGDPGEDSTLAEAWRRWRKLRLETAEDGGLFLSPGFRRRPRPLSFDGTVAVGQTTPRQRRELCVWNTEHVVAFRAPAAPGGGRGLEFPGVPGRHVARGLPWPECVKRFPECERTISEVLPCQDRAQRGDVTFALP